MKLWTENSECLFCCVGAERRVETNSMAWPWVLYKHHFIHFVWLQKEDNESEVFNALQHKSLVLEQRFNSSPSQKLSLPDSVHQNLYLCLHWASVCLPLSFSSTLNSKNLQLQKKMRQHPCQTRIMESRCISTEKGVQNHGEWLNISQHGLGF